MNVTRRLVTALALGAATAWGRTITEIVPATSEELIGSLAISYDARGEGDAADALYVAWGATDAGDDLSAWPNVRRVKRLPAEAGTATFTFPDDALTAGDLQARVFLTTSIAPYDYLAESLRGTGEQYFDTGFTVSPASCASITACFDSIVRQMRPFGVGCGDGTSLFTFAAYVNGNGYWASALQDGQGDWQSADVTTLASTRYALTLDGPAKTYTVANALTGATLVTKTHGTTTTKTATDTLLVFAYHEVVNGEARVSCLCTAGDLYAFTLASNGVAQCDWIPCAVDGRGGMYDRVSGTVVYSASGTDFSPVGNVTTTLFDGETVLSSAAAVTVAGTSPDPTDGAVWKGTASGTWDFARANWLVNGVAGQTWQDGLAAYFNANAAVRDVTLGATVKPATLYVQGARDYVITGNGLSGTGGLVKTGSGTLTITGVHDFTGDVLLAGGETILTANNDVRDPLQSGLGNPRAAGGRAIVVSNATLRTIGQNPLSGSGRSGTDATWQITLDNATLETTTNFPLNVGNLVVRDSTINLHGAVNYAGGDLNSAVKEPTSPAWWGSLSVRNLAISGTRPFVLEASDYDDPTTSWDERMQSALLLGFDNRQAEINVAKIVSGADNTDARIDIPIAWAAGSVGAHHAASGFRKTGAGVLELAGNTSRSTYTGDVDVVEGTLKLASGFASGDIHRRSAFGAQRYPHTVTVHEGARLWITASDTMGQALAVPSNVSLVVKGKLQLNEGTCSALGPTTFENATFTYKGLPASAPHYWPDADGNAGALENVQWPTVVFPCGVAFKGTNAYTLANNGNARISFGAGEGRPGDVWVDEITGKGTADSVADVTIGAFLADMPAWYVYTWKDGTRVINAAGLVNLPGRALNLRKTGPGMLMLNNNNNATTGRIEVAEGTLRVSTRGAFDWPATTSAIGDLTDSNRVALVVSGSGVFEFTASDVFGQAACVNESIFCITNGGTLRSIGNIANGLPRLDLYDANIEYNGGLNSGTFNPPYGTFIFAHRVCWDGTRPYDLQPVGTGNYFCLGHEVDTYTVLENDGAITNLHGKVAFDVADITGDARPDVTLGVVLKTIATWGGNNNKIWGATRFWTGLVKEGAGTLALNGADPEGKYYTEATRVAAGALLVDTHKFNSTNVFVAAGAYVGGTGTVKRATFAAGAGLTAAPGQTQPLTLNAVELPGDGSPLVVSVPVAGALKDVTSVRVPIAKATGALASATFTAVVNGGAEIPTGHSARAFVQGGVLWGAFSRNGMAIILR